MAKRKAHPEIKMPFNENASNLAIHRADVKSITDIVKLIRTNFGFISLLALITLVCYFPGLTNDFVSDDIPEFVEKTEVRSLGASFKTMLLPKIVYALSYHFFGLTPLPLHLFSLSIHIVVSILSFIFLSLLFEKRKAKLASLLFAVFPVNSESVYWISSIGYLLLTASFLLIATTFVIYKNSNNIRFLLISAGLQLLSFFLIRTPWEVTTFLKMVALNYMLWTNKESWVVRVKNSLPFLFSTVIIVSALYIGGRVSGRLNLFSDLKKEQLAARAPYIVRIPFITYNNTRLLLYPLPLSFFHSGEQVDEKKFVLMVTTTIILLITIIFLVMKKKQKVASLMLLYFASISPTLTPTLISFLYAERYMYTGTLFFCIGLAWLLISLEEKTKIKRLALSVTIVLASLYFTRTFVRAKDWTNSKSLWLATAIASPNSAEAHNSLGYEYHKEKNFEKAIEEYTKAITLKPYYADPLHNIANTYLEKGDLKIAADYYQKSIEVNPQAYLSYLNLSSIEYQQGHLEKSREYLVKTLQLKPDFELAQTALQTVESDIAKQKMN